MLKNIPPRTSAERQRDFVKRHPGYYRKYRHRHFAAGAVPQAVTPSQVLTDDAPSTAPISTEIEITIAAMAA